MNFSWLTLWDARLETRRPESIRACLKNYDTCIPIDGFFRGLKKEGWKILGGGKFF